MIGNYVNGCGLAYKFAETNQKRINLLDKYFNCKMYGTFNIKIKRP